MIEVAAAILEESGEILICQRGPGGGTDYLWEFPGGKLEPGETGEQCLIRECREELGIEIDILSLYASTDYEYPDGPIRFWFYRARRKRGIPVATVHEAICWAKPEDLKDFEFCPADIEVVSRLSDRNN